MIKMKFLLFFLVSACSISFLNGQMKHVIVTYYHCDPEIVRSKSTLTAIVAYLSKQAGTERTNEPLTEYTESGYTLLHALSPQNGHIALHTENGNNQVNITIASDRLPGQLILKTIIEHVKKQLKATSYKKI